MSKQIKKMVMTLIPKGSYAGLSKFYFFKDGKQLTYTYIESININLEARIKIGEATLYLHTDNIYDAGGHSYHVEYIFGGNGDFYTKNGSPQTIVTVTVEEGVLDFDYATYQMWVDGYSSYYLKSINIDFYDDRDTVVGNYYQEYSTTPEKVIPPKLNQFFYIKDNSGKYYYIKNSKITEVIDKDSDYIEDLTYLNKIKEQITQLQNPKLVSKDAFTINYIIDTKNLFSDININTNNLNSIINIISENSIKNLGFLIKLNNKYYGIKYYKITELSEQELLSKYIVTNETIEVFNNWYKTLSVDEKNGNIIIKLYFNLNENEELKKLLINYLIYS